ncbi:hypothetical protein M413DRAFT_441109 [Hebeloma cylindrosporum]|uniref:Uncharacterized protein n=1 Tax=Hebeloma cylindrosporum TaxID=76867 RepID=A0A0C2YYI6_HEBCY|nr:hypothetical protein M413DRAFT_441109 [Hebeloma cylindrosporum h7]
MLMKASHLTPSGNPFLVSVQDVDKSEVMISQYNTTPEQRTTPHKQRRQSQSDRLSDSVIAPATSRSPKNQGGRKTPLKASKNVPVFDEQWEAHMKTQISQDFQLHMRVLRFEPVHFNVFLELATLYAPCNNKLKVHLRTFLDKQAIHFYEGLQWARKRT